MVIFNKSFEELNLDDINQLIENKIPESHILDYKRDFCRKNGDINSEELSKDVSSFANEDGGYLIYGLECDKGDAPKKIVGVETSPKLKESIEQKIRTSISRTLFPRIKEISLDTEIQKSVFIIKISKSSNSPHRNEINNKYYRRGEYESIPMKENEIREKYEQNAKLHSNVTIKIEDEIKKYGGRLGPTLYFYVAPVYQNQTLMPLNKETKDFLEKIMVYEFKIIPNLLDARKDGYEFVEIENNQQGIFARILYILNTGFILFACDLNNEKYVSPIYIAKKILDMLKVTSSYFEKFVFIGDIVIGCKLKNVQDKPLQKYLKFQSGLQNLNDEISKAKENEFDTLFRSYDSEYIKSNILSIRKELVRDIVRQFSLHEPEIFNVEGKVWGENR